MMASTYHSYGTVTILGAVVIPFQAVTELLLIQWVKEELGESEVEAIETDPPGETPICSREAQRRICSGSSPGSENIDYEGHS